MEAEVITFFKIAAWSTGPMLAVIAGAMAWGWARAKIAQHDTDITGARAEMATLKKENKDDHDSILEKLDDVNHFVGRVEQYMNGEK